MSTSLILLLRSLPLASPPAIAQQSHQYERRGRQHQNTIIQTFRRPFTQLLRCFGAQRALCEEIAADDLQRQYHDENH